MRGLKFYCIHTPRVTVRVALLVSAWIEISHHFFDCQRLLVALLVSAWIEIATKLIVLPEP